MTPDDPARLAAELATQIVTSRVSAASGRPNITEGRDLAGYFRIVLGETRRALGLPPIQEPEVDAG